MHCTSQLRNLSTWIYSYNFIDLRFWLTQSGASVGIKYFYVICKKCIIMKLSWRRANVINYVWHMLFIQYFLFHPAERGGIIGMASVCQSVRRPSVHNTFFMRRCAEHNNRTLKGQMLKSLHFVTFKTLKSFLNNLALILTIMRRCAACNNRNTTPRSRSNLKVKC